MKFVFGLRQAGRRRGACGSLTFAAALSLQAHVIAGFPVFGGPERTASGDGFAATSPDGFGIALTNGVAVTPVVHWTSGTGVVSIARFSPTSPGQELATLGTGIGGHNEPLISGVLPDGTALGTVNRYSSAGTYEGFRAATWMPGESGPHELPNISDDVSAYSSVLAANESADMVGFAYRYDVGVSVGTRAVMWTAHGTQVHELTPLSVSSAGTTYTLATDIADSGIIVGYGAKFDEKGQNSTVLPIRWDAAGHPMELQPLSVPAGVNISYNHQTYLTDDAGTVAATLDIPKSQGYDIAAIRWDVAGNPTRLQAIGVNPNGSNFTEVNAISHSGIVIGRAQKYDPQSNASGYRAVRWDPGSITPVALEELAAPTSGAFSSVALAINRSEVIAGQAQNYGPTEPAAGPLEAVLWTPDGHIVRLNSLIDDARWTLQAAEAIDDVGFVTGSGKFDPDGPQPAYSRPFIMLVPSAGSYGRGDANFDTNVDFDDLLVLAQHYGQQSYGSINVADFNLDGTVDFDDLLTLAQHYQGAADFASAPTGFLADWELARSLTEVPEPVASTSAILPVAFLVRRIRRR